MNVILNEIRKIVNQSTANENGDFMHPNIKYNDTLWCDLSIENIELSDLDVKDELYELEVFYTSEKEVENNELRNTRAFHSSKYDKSKKKLKIAVSIVLLRSLYGKSEDISLSELETTSHIVPVLFEFIEKRRY